MAFKPSGKTITYIAFFLLAGLVLIWSKKDDIKRWQQRRRRNQNTGVVAITASVFRQGSVSGQISQINSFIANITNHLQRAPLPRKMSAASGTQDTNETFSPWFVLSPETTSAETNITMAGYTNITEFAEEKIALPQIVQIFHDFKNREWLSKDQNSNTYATGDVWKAPNGNAFRFIAIDPQWVWVSRSNISLPADFRPSLDRIHIKDHAMAQIVFEDVEQPLQPGKKLIWNTYAYEIVEITPDHVIFEVTIPSNPKQTATVYCIPL